VFNAKQQGRELATTTVGKHPASLKVLMATAVEDELIRHNPAAQARLSRPAKPDEQPPARAMTPEQLTAVMRALDPEWRLFFELLAATGLRIGEALELRWSDVDLGAKRLRVTRQVSKDGVVGPPKSSTGVRSALQWPGGQQSSLRTRDTVACVGRE